MFNGVSNCLVLSFVLWLSKRYSTLGPLTQGFQNKLAIAGVSWLYVAGYSGYSNHLATNKLTCHGCLLFQLLTPTSKHFETPANTYDNSSKPVLYCSDFLLIVICTALGLLQTMVTKSTKLDGKLHAGKSKTKKIHTWLVEVTSFWRLSHSLLSNIADLCSTWLHAKKVIFKSKRANVNKRLPCSYTVYKQS